MTTLAQWATYVLIGYFVVLNSGYVLMSVFTFFGVVRYRYVLDAYNPEEALTSKSLPSITLIAPSYNEESTCIESVRAFLNLDYPNFEVLVVNDGSTDDTLERLRKTFDLQPAPRPPTSDLSTEPVKQVYRSRTHPDLWVIDKENGGKADALNTGINFCETSLFCAMDADTIVESEGLIRIVRPFLEDTSTVAVGGIVRVANGCTIQSGRIQEVSMPQRLLPKLQVLEYLRAFFFGRLGWDTLHAMIIISGAFGMFRRETVVEVGGYHTDSVTEDLELVLRMHRRLRENDQGYRIRFIPDPVAWTEVPATLHGLGSQRDRWHRGMVDSMIEHQRMLLNPTYGRVGLLAYPFFYFLETFGVALEIVGYAWFIIAAAAGYLSGPIALAFFLLAFAFGTALSLSAVALEELSFHRYESTLDLFQLLLLTVLDGFGYRQLIAWWRIRGLWSYLQGDKEWGAIERMGFSVPSQ
jgi:cellulose synthase/poly-beta-1,6-N-acetylglucosamine synthase-like glycosyltransferase